MLVFQRFASQHRTAVLYPIDRRRVRKHDILNTEQVPRDGTFPTVFQVATAGKIRISRVLWPTKTNSPTFARGERGLFIPKQETV